LTERNYRRTKHKGVDVMLDMIAGIFTSQYTRHAPAITAYVTKALQQAQTGGNRVNGKQQRAIDSSNHLEKGIKQSKQGYSNSATEHVNFAIS